MANLEEKVEALNNKVQSFEIIIDLLIEGGAANANGGINLIEKVNELAGRLEKLEAAQLAELGDGK